MQFTQDQSAGVNLVRSHTVGELRINETVLRGPLIVAAHFLLLLDDLETVQGLSMRHIELIKAQKPELVLIGSGARPEYPQRNFMNEFLRAEIGIEAMTTAAACRTYNVLVSERRAVAALLIP